MITVLAGGGDGARFLRGLAEVVPADQISVVANVGDDVEMWGLYVSPDTDAILYALSDRLDVDRGWGLRNETFHCLEAINRFGEPTWFKLGDQDLATHLVRTAMMRKGASLSETVRHLRTSLHVAAHILPATDHRLQTKIETPEGMLDFQEYFMREQWRTEVRSVHYSGAEECMPGPGVLDALHGAETIIVAPNNPITSIGSILAVPQVRDALRCARAEVVAISPITAADAISGPAAKLMEACGYDATAEGVARCYHDFLDLIVVDTSDAGMARVIRTEDSIAVETTNLRLSGPDAAARLAEFVVRKAHEHRSAAREGLL